MAVVADRAAQLGAGLSAVQGVGIVHRDLKPGNIMRTHEGRILVIDLGLAAAADLTRMTPTGALLGTPTYMAPEQRAGRPEIGVEADVHAFGPIGYAALSPPFPFPSRSAVASIVARSKADPSGGSTTRARARRTTRVPGFLPPRLRGSLALDRGRPGRPARGGGAGATMVR